MDLYAVASEDLSDFVELVNLDGFSTLSGFGGCSSTRCRARPRDQ